VIGPRLGGSAAALIVAAGLTGCGGDHGGRSRAHPSGGGGSAAAKLAQAEATHEYPGPAPPAQSAPGAGSPTAAIARFARAYINWTAADVAAKLAALARDSIGQARSEMTLASAAARGDPTLAQGGIANSGTVEAVASRIGHPGEYVVVTRESTAASATTSYQGLAPAWHLTVATVTDLALRGRTGGWVLSGWQPES
jgi:hypothetical protein